VHPRAFDRLTILLVVLMLGTVSVTFAEGVRQRIKFPRGRTSTIINNAVLRDEIDQYILNARAGQKMKIDITSVEDNATFEIVRPDKTQLLPGAGWDDDAKHWSGELPESGDYTIEVAPTRGNATYGLKVEIR
jgi:type II secretory pathway pseudopilin PulG